MNNSFDMRLLSHEIDDTRSMSITDNNNPSEYDPMPSQTGAHVSRSTTISTSTSGSKRQKDISPCYVCGAKAHGYNFDQSKDQRKKMRKQTNF